MLDWEWPNGSTLVVTSKANPVEDENCFTVFRKSHKAPQSSTFPDSIPSEMEKKHTQNSVSPSSEFVFSPYEQDLLTSEKMRPMDTWENVNFQS